MPVPVLATPSAVAFGNVLVGVNYTQTVLLSNVGSTDLIVTQVATTGNGYGATGISLPLQLAAGQSASLVVTFESTKPGGVFGTLVVASNAPASPMTIGLSATVGAALAQLTVSSSSVSFGNAPVGAATTQTVTLTNTGNSAVSISSVSAGGVAFAVNDAQEVTLAPNQSVTVAVSFSPTVTGLAIGNLIVTSNAPPVQVGLSGNGAATAQSTVALSWNPSVSTVAGYYVYRSAPADDQLSKLTDAIVSSTSYQDSTVASGQTYIYAVTSVGSNNIESAFSTPVSVTIP
ncbi:MAG: choice-of-anchor D domain-containing protein [Candidatus Acidiferrales bacterium]